MSDEVDHVDGACPKCGEYEVYRQDCYVLGCDDGQIDGYDEDPMWYDEGDTYGCPECGGRGYFMWCAKCGANLAEVKFAETEGEP